MCFAETLIPQILDHYPETQAVYLFGSHASGDVWPGSDIDLGVLLPVEIAGHVKFTTWNKLAVELAVSAGVDCVDLINLRLVDTVFRKEIISADCRIFCGDETAADEFEMLTLSFYQQLQFERKEIVEQGRLTGRFYNV